MSDLEEAVHVALQEVRSLRQRVGEASGGCHEASGYVAKLSERLAADAEALHLAVAELDKTVQAGEQHLSDEMVAAEPALTDIVNASHEAGNQGLQTLQAESTALDELAHHIQGIGPQVAALAETAEAASRAALARAEVVADALNQAMDDAEQLLSIEFASVIADMGRELDTTTTAILSLLNDLCPSILQEQEKDFQVKTDQARQAMDDLFPAMSGHADEVSAYCVEKVTTLADEDLDEIESQVRALDGELENATRLAAEKNAEIARAGQALAERQLANGEAATQVDGALQDVRGRWVLFGFSI